MLQFDCYLSSLCFIYCWVLTVFSKREYVKSLAEKGSLEVDFFYGQDQLPPLSRLLEQNLFSKAKIFVIEQGIGQYEFTDKDIEQLAASPNHIIFSEEKLDKRGSKKNKKLLENKKVQVANFVLPHGRELNAWIEKRVSLADAKITPQAVENLAKRLGRDETKETKIAGKVVEAKEVFSLWQADNEIKKLMALAQGRAIEENDVMNLVAINEEADVLDIVNAIADGKRTAAVSLLGKFMAQEQGSDEKSKVIQLNALLSDQFRSISLMQDFLARKITEMEIQKKTSWKSGRIYVMKRIAASFKPQKIIETLKKLEALDEELKTSSTPPKVLLDLIVAQLF